jgi:hypothetical protein
MRVEISRTLIRLDNKDNKKRKHLKMHFESLPAKTFGLLFPSTYDTHIHVSIFQI